MFGRWNVITASVIVFSVVLSACAPASGGQPAATAAPAAANPSAAPAPAKAALVGPAITLRVGHDSAESSTKQAGALYWAKILDEKSGGSIKMQVFPNGSLGHDAQSIQALQAGTIDGWIVGTSMLFPQVPETQLVSAPYLFDDTKQALNFYEHSPLIKDFQQKVAQKNVHLLSWGELGFRQLTNKVRPIKTASDLVGLKMRVPAVAMYQKVFQLLGTTGIQTDFSELYLALQQGTVDGQDNPIEPTYSSKFYEVQPNLSLIGWCYEAYVFLIGDPAWKRLTPDQQKIIEDTAIEAARWQVKETDNREADMLGDMEKSKGVKVVRDVDKASFKEKLAPMQQQLQDQFGKDMIDRLNKDVADAKKG